MENVENQENKKSINAALAENLGPDANVGLGSKELSEKNEKMAMKALRVIAIAYKELESLPRKMDLKSHIRFSLSRIIQRKY